MRRNDRTNIYCPDPRVRIIARYKEATALLRSREERGIFHFPSEKSTSRFRQLMHPREPVRRNYVHPRSIHRARCAIVGSHRYRHSASIDAL